ncbi:MAG: ABC transporter ATP-binding protein [Lachnospiraceae bacterium]|nr:ABC transporter ATP-binding protein [Lachnospiraceae bacterium]
MSTAEQAYVELRKINKHYGEYHASRDVDFSIDKGKLVALLGPSGSGKTTILRMLAGLEQADSGDILIDGKRVNDTPASERGIGFVFQSYALFRYKTVYENIAFPLKIAKWNRADIKARVEELLELVGLQGMEKRYPNQLSGGQRQRVAFARALAIQPQLLLLDEPFAAIDAKVRQELRSWLRELISRVGITSIFVTHDQDEAIEVADEIIITNQGRVEQIGTPLEIYQNPHSAFVAKFLGRPSELTDAGSFKGFSHVEPGLTALIRPEYVSVTKKNELCKYPITTEDGEVLKTAFRGNAIEVTLRVRDQEIIAGRTLNEPLVEPGEHVNVFIHSMYVLKGDITFYAQNGVLISENYTYI